MDPRLPIGDVGSFAVRVERLGYDGLHVAEMIHDPYVASALALDATSDLHVRTSVALAFVRSPMATALSAWELAQLSGGRFDLGLGTQIRANVEDRYGMEFDRPVARMGDHIEAIRACFHTFETGTPLHHDGDFHRLTRLQPDFRPDPLGGARRPEVWVGAVGNQMVGLAGAQADGLITHPTNSHPVDLADRVVPGLAAGARRAGRAVPPVVVSPMIVTGPDRAALDDARQPVRRRLAFLYSTPAYRPTLELLGLGDLGPRLRQLTRDDAWDELPGLLDDGVLQQMVPIATWDRLPDVLIDRYGAVADGLVLRPPADPGDDTVFAGVISRLRDAP